MNSFLHILRFELRSRWFFAFMPIIYLCVFVPNLMDRRLGDMSIVLGPGFIFIFQMAMMTAPIFQNAPWGGRDIRFASLEFSFTRAISRIRLFWAKVAIYLLACSSIGLSYLAFSAYEPNLTLRGEYGDKDSAILGRFYEENFPGSVMRAPEKRFGSHPIDVPGGNVANALAILACSLMFGVVYQLVQSFLPETKLSLYLLIGGTILTILFIIFLPNMLGWSRLVVSPYERFVAAIWHHPILAASALLAILGAIEFYCCRRFLQKEVL